MKGVRVLRRVMIEVPGRDICVDVEVKLDESQGTG